MQWRISSFFAQAAMLDTTNRIDILISTKDRPHELVNLLHSLATQTFQFWDCIIIDGSAGDQRAVPSVLKAIIQLERMGHEVMYERIQVQGVLHTRERCQELSDKEWVVRVDDDCILNPDYLWLLVTTRDALIMKGMNPGIISGITPLWGQPQYSRDPYNHLGETCKLTFNDDGDITELGDDCGFDYVDQLILHAGHFRSCALHKRGLWKYTDFPLSNVGFREEAFASLTTRWAGYSIWVNTGAKAWHSPAPTGGCRYPNYDVLVQHDDVMFRRWAKRKFKKHGVPIC